MLPRTLTGDVVQEASTGADSRTVEKTKVGSDARGNLLKEATDEGTGRDITMPRGLDHRPPDAYPTEDPKRDLI
jgi:hypothetical protein